MIQEHFFDRGSDLLAALEASVVARLELSLAERERASLLVSGGNSPKPLYQRLAQSDLPWDRVDVALVDERWVPESHPRSNARFIRETLLQDKAGAANFTVMYTGDATAAQGLEAIEAAYRRLPAPFDATLLGMGPDGHTASLFPRAEGLETALDVTRDRLCAAVTARQSEVTGQEVERATLSLAGIVNSRSVYLLIGGEVKLQRYREALKGEKETHDLPVRSVLKQRELPLSVYWSP